MIALEHYLVVAGALFLIGGLGVFRNRHNLIVILICLQLMLLAVNLNFVAFSHYLGDLAGQVFSLLIVSVSASQAVIGLAILVCFFRARGSVAVDDATVMKG